MTMQAMTTMTLLSALNAGTLHAVGPVAGGVPLVGTMTPQFADTLADAGVHRMFAPPAETGAPEFNPATVQSGSADKEAIPENKVSNASASVLTATSAQPIGEQPLADGILNKAQTPWMRQEPPTGETWVVSTSFESKETTISPQPTTLLQEESVSPATTRLQSVDPPGLDPRAKTSPSEETPVSLPKALSEQLPVRAPVEPRAVIAASSSKPAGKTERGISQGEKATKAAKESKADPIAQLAQPDYVMAAPVEQGHAVVYAPPAVPRLQTQEPIRRVAPQDVQERPSASREIVMPTKGWTGSTSSRFVGRVQPEAQSSGNAPVAKPADTSDVSAVMPFVERAHPFEAAAMPSEGSGVAPVMPVVEQARSFETMATPLVKSDAPQVMALVEQIQQPEAAVMPFDGSGMIPIERVVEQNRPLDMPVMPVVEQAQPLEGMATPRTAGSARPARKATIEGTRAAEPKTSHASIAPAPVLVAANNNERVTPRQDEVVTQATVDQHASSAHAAMTVVAFSGPATSVPVATQANVAPLTQPAELRASHGSVPVTDAAMPTLAHTTLSASPTVLEVGVAGGSHGWLKIRAEIGDSGTVQASLVSASHTGHETLHRDLPEMAAFLANEQLPVQLHIAETPRSIVTEQNPMQFSTASGGRDGGQQHESSNQQPPASASSFLDGSEAVWSSSEYGPSTPLHGGSWVNVVA